VVRVEHLRHVYREGGAGDLLVLDDVNIALADREIVALLGRSGSGKSTLLRIIAGLMPPTDGAVAIAGQAVDGPADDVAMVFQSFALFPWLTVLENVEIGLEAQGVAADERRKRALAAIDLIGLDGYESAFPKELSGGMRQRVGFARALVVHPQILLMDEPFSALDVLTAETLRTDFLDLWSDGRTPIKGVLLVTHNIEEAVLMCDRIMIFGSNPGRILTEIPVTLPQPRNRLDPSFAALVERIYVEMTLRRPATDAKVEGLPGQGLGTILPLASEPFNGKADLPEMASLLQMEIDELFPVAETLQMLRFAQLEGGDIRLLDAGAAFARATVDERKKIFARQLVAYVPLAAHVRRVLDERASHVAPMSRFSDEIEDYMTPEAAEGTLRAVISWGRYAELFAYDDEKARFSLENPT
jgi:NitT/TauT family transport system ATP-binding protein